MNYNQLKNFYSLLKTAKRVSSVEDFAKLLGKSRQYMSAAMNGTEALTNHVVNLIKATFPAEYSLFEGWGLEPKYDEIDKFKSASDYADIESIKSNSAWDALNRTLALFEKYVEDKEEVIKQKNALIESQENKIYVLTAELERLKKAKAKKEAH